MKDDVVEIPTKGMGQNIEALAETIVHVRYSDADKARWAKTIKDFNKLYWETSVQTWAITRWRGVFVLKPPTDMWIYQELIQDIKPSLIIETGTCHGGSALFMRDVLDKVNPAGHIISIDITHENLMEKAKVSGIIHYLGSSVDDETIKFVKDFMLSRVSGPVMVILDSDHKKDHVLKEIELYASLVTPGSILIIEDTNNDPGPREAVEEAELYNQGFRKNVMCEKFMLTFNRDGYWEKLKEGEE